MAVFPQAPPHRPQRAVPRPGGRHGGDEAPQSQVGVPADRPTDRSSLRHPDRQGRGPPSASDSGSVRKRTPASTHYRPGPGSGPSWLTFLGQTKDSLWSMDLFRCESAILRSHWVLVVMDQYTRRIVGFGIHAGIVDGRALCRMFNHAVLRTVVSDTPQRRSRPVVPVPPMAGQPAGAAGDRRQKCAVCPRVPSVRRTADRHVAARVCGPNAVLVGVGPRTEAGSLSGLLQRASDPCRVTNGCFPPRADARPDTAGCRAARPLRLASALPRALSDAHRGLTSPRRRRRRTYRHACAGRPSRHSRGVHVQPVSRTRSSERRG